MYSEELTNVLVDAIERSGKDHLDEEDLQWFSFPETWSSTALGFGGMGGQMITTAQTYIVLSWEHNQAFIYWGGQFGKEVDIKQAREMISKHRTS